MRRTCRSVTWDVGPVHANAPQSGQVARLHRTTSRFARRPSSILALWSEVVRGTQSSDSPRAHTGYGGDSEPLPPDVPSDLSFSLTSGEPCQLVGWRAGPSTWRSVGAECHCPLGPTPQGAILPAATSCSEVATAARCTSCIRYSGSCEAVRLAAVGGKRSGELVRPPHLIHDEFRKNTDFKRSSGRGGNT